MDDRRSPKATRLKLLCRLNCLPLMDRVGREAKPTKWPKGARKCPMCKEGKLEDVAHFITECPAYASHRERLNTQVTRALEGNEVLSGESYGQMDAHAQTRVLLGQRVGDPTREDRIDRHIKRFLTKAWNIRKDMTATINRVMGTSYEVYPTAENHPA
jgi:hypothetical protein